VGWFGEVLARPTEPVRILLRRFVAHRMDQPPANVGSQCPPRLGRRWLPGLACSVLLLLTAAGCRSTQAEIYTADVMPPQLAAAPRQNAQTIDLSRLASAAVNSDVIDKGDVLEVSIAAGLSEKDRATFPCRVLDSGMAELPNVSPLSIAGMELEAAEAAITAHYTREGVFRNPLVTVTMKKQRANRVTVVGAVKKPGVYSIPRGRSDLLAAIVAAEGLSEDAGTQVEIRNPTHAPSLEPAPIADARGMGLQSVGHTPATPVALSQFQTLKVDLVSATKTGTSGYTVLDGGVVYVEKRDPEPLHVLGLVAKPNRYEMPVGQDLRVLDAIALAGGISNPVANRVYVIRKYPESNQTAIVNVSISDAKRHEINNIRLAPGDVVSVEQTPSTVIIEALRFMNLGFGATLPLTAVF
jgi:polysaccharide export outer membrane protein